MRLAPDLTLSMLFCVCDMARARTAAVDSFKVNTVIGCRSS